MKKHFNPSLLSGEIFHGSLKLPGLYSIKFCSNVVGDLEQACYVNYMKYL